MPTIFVSGVNFEALKASLELLVLALFDFQRADLIQLAGEYVDRQRLIAHFARQLVQLALRIHIALVEQLHGAHLLAMGVVAERVQYRHVPGGAHQLLMLVLAVQLDKQRRELTKL